ncbi:MAG: glycosyltransferase family 4 protein [Candidatus Curtissbacteria bacterium]|nr:glycosyltransferase family 4 protein [Candidatus Curtissbacteria bacterium]
MVSLRIALLAGLKRPITPNTTVSRNRIIADLATGLVRKGHEVTIFGTADSNLPGVKFVPVIETGLSFYKLTENPFYTDAAYITHATVEFIKQQSQFDLFHNHMYPEFLPLLALSSINIPTVTTIHGQITDELRMALLDTQGKSQLVCISESARKRFNAPAELVYNGIDTSFYTPIDNPKKDYILFIGRMAKGKKDGKFIDPKGVVSAIEASQKSGEHLRIVGNVEDRKFYDELVAPNLSDKIELIGGLSNEQNLTREEVRDLHRDAKAFLFPINWEEPFGLVMVEAMACGTPVIAYNRGSVPEIVRDGLTGFIIDPDSEDRPGKGGWVIKKQGIEGLIEAIRRIGEIDRKACRKHVEENFTVEKMVENYEKLYLRILSGRQ